MSLFCLYSVETNALLGVDLVPLQSQPGQAVAVLARDTLPDFALEEWNPNLLAFFTKQTAAVSKREFVKRFTPTEYATIKAAAAQNATLDYYWQMFMLAEFITLSDQDTIAGVTMLEQAGLLGEGRAAEILA